MALIFCCRPVGSRSPAILRIALRAFFISKCRRIFPSLVRERATLPRRQGRLPRRLHRYSATEIRTAVVELPIQELLGWLGALRMAVVPITILPAWRRRALLSRTPPRAQFPSQVHESRTLSTSISRKRPELSSLALCNFSPYKPKA